ncbi:MAG: hypothetical protein IT556_04985, partial [Acetobacteraceae bacterium]|nr:hypothetical protein [Acetobacteraceae bacterium]
MNLSPTVNAVFGRAAAEAVADQAGMVGLRHLILGALQLGETETVPGSTAPQFAAAFVRAVRAATARQDFTEALRGADVKGGFEAPFSPMAQAAIAQARLFARLASGEDFLAARHLIMALTFPLRPGLRAATRRVWQTRWQLDPEVLRPALIDAMEREIAAREGNGRPEDRTAWQSLFGTRRDTPAFAPDAAAPARIDPLGHAEDARRIAELACLKANEPPMAIALFGDWGSGKSTFMRRLQEAVDDIAATWRDEADKAPFCTQVAQLRFNAWTYADANLWASFAVAIFGGLRAEVGRIVGASQPSAYDDLMDAIAAANGRATAIDSGAAAAIDALDKDIAKTETKIADASRRLQRGLQGEA